MKENNRLIAEFMGYTLNENDEYPIEYITVQGHWDTCSIQDLNYHKSWDWLMKVVEKIENFNFVDNIFWVSVCRRYMGAPIEVMFESVVEFINFYNKQKEE